MIKERKGKNMQWFVEDNLKIRLKIINEKQVCFWVMKDNKNICFIMIMNDFMDWCEHNLGMQISVDKNWNNHRGFVVDIQDQMIVPNEVQRFVTEFSIEPSGNSENFLYDEWYSEI